MAGNGWLRGRKTVGIGVMLVLLLGFVAPVVAAPDRQPAFPGGASEYFWVTGHFVQGPFLEFFRKYGGARIFGYPQTEVYYDSRLGLWVQYFNNVRMEWHPENPEPYKVQLGLLGEELGYREPPIPPEKAPRNNPYQRYFPETGHVVAYSFLTFYDKNGGLDIFGYPISEMRLENGRMVQYFQRTRLEWHPERPSGDRVVVGALGDAYMQKFPVPEDAKKPRQANNVPPLPPESTGTSELRAYASVRSPVTGREGYQTVFLYVTNASRQPMRGIPARVIVNFPNGQTEEYAMEATGIQGISTLTFYFSSLRPGQKVVINVLVQAGNRTITATTSFVVWY